VTHEYCHCFTHPKFYEATDQSPNRRELLESLNEHITNKVNKPMIFGDYARKKLSNGKKMTQAAQELEDAVGEATLMRAYFSGDKEAIRKISSAAVDIFPKRVTPSAWSAIEKVDASYKQQLVQTVEAKKKAVVEALKEAYASGDKKAISKAEKDFRNINLVNKSIESYSQHLAECFVGASLLAEGKLPPTVGNFPYVYKYLPVSDFSTINPKQQKEIKQQAEQARERLGAAFDQAFYNFDKEAAKEAMKAVHEDLRTNWKHVLPETTDFF